MFIDIGRDLAHSIMRRDFFKASEPRGCEGLLKVGRSLHPGAGNVRRLRRKPQAGLKDFRRGDNLTQRSPGV